MKELEAGRVRVTALRQEKDGTDKVGTIEPFYRIDQDDHVALDPGPTSQALRFLGIGLLRQLENAGHLQL